MNPPLRQAVLRQAPVPPARTRHSETLTNSLNAALRALPGLLKRLDAFRMKGPVAVNTPSPASRRCSSPAFQMPRVGEQAHAGLIELGGAKCRSTCGVSLPAQAGRCRAAASASDRRNTSAVAREQEPSRHLRSEGDNGAPRRA